MQMGATVNRRVPCCLRLMSNYIQIILLPLDPLVLLIRLYPECGPFVLSLDDASSPESPRACGHDRCSCVLLQSF